MSDPNVRILIDNKGDSATITASPAFESNFPISNVKNPLRSYFARTTGLATQEIYLNWGGDTHSFTALNMSRINLSSAATVRFRIWSGENQTGTLVYDSGDVLAVPPKALGDLNWGIDPLGASLFTGWTGAIFTTLWFTQVYGQSAQITINDPANTDGYIKIGRLFTGFHFEPDYNMAWGMTISNENNHIKSRTDGGSMRVDLRSTYRKINFQLPELRDEQRAVAFNQIKIISDNATDFFISCFPEQNNEHERNYSMVARLDSTISINNNHWSNYATNWSAVEN